MSSDNNKIFQYIAENKKDKIEKLIKEDPNILKTVNNENMQLTPLSYSVMKNKPDIVKMLLKYDKNIDKEDATGWTPLTYASAYNNKNLVDILLKSGAKINNKIMGVINHDDYYDVRKLLKRVEQLEPLIPFLEQAHYKNKLSKSKNKKNKSINFTKDLIRHTGSFLHFSKRKISKKSYKIKIVKVSIKKSTKADKKLMAIFTIKNDSKMIDNSKITTKIVHFGAKGYSDYTIHKDPERKQRYINRHKANEKWTGSIKSLMTAGALSRWILWNKPTLKASIEDYKKKLYT